MRKFILFVIVCCLVIFTLNFRGQDVSAAYHSYAVIDAKTGRLLFGENPHERLPIASLTKVWTALIAIEQNDLKDIVTVSDKAAGAEGSSIYLKGGDEVEVEKLLYGLMLRSGNDAATALSEFTAGSVEEFVDMMNEKAVFSGLENTVFTNPSGLHDEEHLSTAYETALMMKLAMENETFRKIASTPLYRYNDSGPNAWQNKHRLVRQDKRAIAGKTGYTKSAGRTLVTFFEDGDRSIIIVTLNNSDDWKVHKQMADRAFSEYEMTTVVKKGKYEVTPKLIGTLEEPISLLLKEGEEDKVKSVVKIFRDPNRKNEAIWHVYIDDELVVSRIVPINKK
ncbi:D-alanyl-D-alanine carboxypeptidase family protein [Chungangia koreensis]|uniref:D-alanyl-D-alanine carboxypeptidase family protein n=1 Tax=Chungangia koreensis TaxID=752657 RepID=A0ABV8X792_9LACT